MMKKVIVIGCSGSGKSVFSRSFANLTKLPLYHLDTIWWREDGSHIERSEFVRNYRETNRPQVMSLLDKYSDKNTIIFKSREESESYLQKITQ